MPAGKPISVTLLQGNIAQELKWSESIAFQTIQQYLSMAKQAKGQLVILPETALPISVETNLQDASQDQVLSAFNGIAQEEHKAILVGIVGKNQDAYFNSVMGFNSVNNHPQFYHKYHLVPFGEFIPLKAFFGWIYRDWLNMPLSDLTPGNKYQQPMQLADQKIAVNICYEDVFGEEIIRQLPEATLLVNVSNDAWYGRSNAADQHMQFSQMRALETGRTLLRATNTGATAMISPQGMILALLPQFETAILNGSAQAYIGATPFVRFGNWPAIGLLLIALILLWGRKKK
jgi:apolipoprotein N-acyltransferase